MTDLPRQPATAAPFEQATHTLTPADARILDWLVEHGFCADQVHLLPTDDQPRALAIIRQMGMLNALHAPAPDDTLVDAVLARVDRFEADRAAALQIGSAPNRRRRMRLADLLGIAAMLMLSAAVLLPIASQVRATSLATVCANNMRTVSAGLGAYANEYGGAMPALAGIGAIDALFSNAPPAARAQPMRGTLRPTADGKGATFTPAPGAQRHSASLSLLITTGHCNDHALQCPGCAKGAPCYAYRVPAQGARFVLNTVKPMVVVADANPVLELRLDGRRVDSFTMSSRNHGDRGQNMLFNDGSVDWKVSPLLTVQPSVLFDNIWLPRDSDGCERADLHGPPRDPTDNFVAQ